ncbi:MAG: S24 family peptidase [gamma proteobacterium symbiont of Bathyaustriella thionipta]|nr:S24 family peptidase [gamma proteobacterium symbiont of Bathyaustriella thionipta]MCU7948538.1 S24 family peptidase [gamma proteobacterium symbiont of Bathyaustriella thionipta]MCU7953845.1 S24 family peptidase [gamma proteobacterium symbiont of Bathyaustriella thionipta]MCU7955045.1 S24 family peptidase [gamma proteobacterium symbiont of Bathyaustriella thionipta]MCU7965717.1 S24 family peptidase [gamma proteobacterium symbiont of Bathyaustriella thionipta]
MSERPESIMPPIEGSCSGREVFALRALGDSMVPEFEHGTVIIIDPEAVVKDGAYVVAKVNGEFIFRQLRIHNDKYFLQPLNDLYETIEINGIDDLEGVIIQSGNRRKNMKKYT